MSKSVCNFCLLEVHGLEETIFVVKEYNLKRYYKSRHKATYDNIRGQEREDKINQLTKSGRRQQNAIT